VSVDSLTPGGTSSNIQCKNANQDVLGTKAVASGQPDLGDGSLSLAPQLEGLYTCTVEITNAP
jgi:hypothetical protein